MSTLSRPFRFRIYLSVTLFLFLQMALSGSSDLHPEVNTLTSYAEFTHLVANNVTVPLIWMVL